MKEIRIIAELGINHNGNISLAKQMIQMAKDAGCHAVKFQKRTVETVYAGRLDDPRNDGNPFGWKTVGDQKHGIEFSMSEFDEIDAFCHSLRIPWFYSAWDIDSAIDMYHRYECPYNKIASAMVTNEEFCKEISSQGRTTFISTGGCTLDEIDNVEDIFKTVGCPMIIMHCVSMYPCPDEDLNMNMLHTLRSRYHGGNVLGFGYSGHEVGIYPSVMAMAMGAEWIERHITINRSMYGSDQAASMEPHGLQQLCEVARSAPHIFGDGKKRILEGEAACMKKLRYFNR